MLLFDHEENSSVEDNVLKTRASAYKKMVNNPSPSCSAYEVSPTRWDVIE